MEITRFIKKNILQSLAQFPVVAIVGPRQVGKTTLARSIVKEIRASESDRAIFLDLERPSDVAKLQDAEFYFERHAQSQGEEIDFVYTRKGKLHACELKSSSSPKIASGVIRTMDELQIDTMDVIVPAAPEAYSMHGGRVHVSSLAAFIGEHTAGR